MNQYFIVHAILQKSRIQFIEKLQYLYSLAVFVRNVIIITLIIGCEFNILVRINKKKSPINYIIIECKNSFKSFKYFAI